MADTHVSSVLTRVSSLALVVALAACVPVEGGPPDIEDVEAHLHIQIGGVPEGCVPVGLDGDGRGRVEGAAFDCGDGATLRIERLDPEVVPGSPSTVPTETDSGRVEWSDGRTGDVIRVVSDQLGSEILFGIAESIGVGDRR